MYFVYREFPWAPSSVGPSLPSVPCPNSSAPHSRFLARFVPSRHFSLVSPSTKVARWQNWIPSFPWIAPGWRGGGATQGKEGQSHIILKCGYLHLATMHATILIIAPEREGVPLPLLQLCNVSATSAAAEAVSTLLHLITDIWSTVTQVKN